MHWKDWCWSWNSNTLATFCEELTHWKRPWCWERLKAGGEGDDRGWDGWVASLTRWTWVWVGSGSWWWTGKPGLDCRLRLDWVTELNWSQSMRKLIQFLSMCWPCTVLNIPFCNWSQLLFISISRSEDKDHGIWSHHFMADRWGHSGNSGNSVRLYFLGSPKSLQMVTAAMKLKDAYSLEGKLWPT